jgi:hypothetical protein
MAKMDTTGNLPSNATYWDAFISGISSEGVYNNATAYVKNDVVAYGGNLYRATGDTTGNLPSDTAHWVTYLGGVKALGAYNPATAYALNDVVNYGGGLYRATTETTGNLPSDAAKWEPYVVGSDFKGAYDPATAYVLNDVVTYGANTYTAKGDTTGNLPTSTAHWDVYSSGISPQGAYNNASAYVPNDLVAYGGSLYKCILESTGNLPTDTTYWSVFQTGINPKGDWGTGTEYEPGDVATYGGNTFRALLAHASTTFAADLAANKWQKYNGGVDFKGSWSTATAFKVDDIVKEGVSSYIALADHTSATFATDLAAAKWQLFAEGGDYVLPTVSGNSGNVLASDGVNYVWVNGETGWSSITTTHTATSTERLFTDTSGGAFTVTLPASPSLGDYIELTDGASTWDTNNLTVARNGSNIQGNALDMVCDVKDAGLSLVYSDATNGWRVK